MHLLRQVICNRRAATHVGKYVRSFVSATNVRASAEPLTVPAPEGSETPANPKLVKIVNDIAALNLLEVSELSTLLKKTLNLPDAPVVAYGAGAPVAAQATPAEDAEEAAGAAPIQTLFKVKLNSFDESKKIVLIKELKNQCEGMNLVQAKKFIESAPAVVKEDLSKEEAEALKAALEKFGAVIEVV